MTTAYLDRLSQQLDALAAAGRRRVTRPVAAADAAHVERDGRVLLNVSSNDYLGLSRHPLLIERARSWAETMGVGATASRLVCGTLEAHAAVEDKLAAFKGTEAALVLNSGYQANEAMLAALLMPDVAGKAPLVFVDRLAHASMHEGLKAAGVRQIRFRHNDMAHLEDLLRKREGEPGPRFIVTESVFSMDGDRADLPALCDLAERFGAFLYVDEAHATGVLGPHGRGLTCDPAVAGRIHMVMGTFGKALGGFGAYAACSSTVRDWLVNKAGGFIYSTALPPTVLGAIDAALDLVPTLEAERARLHANADRLRAVLSARGLDCCGSTTQIVPAVLGTEDAALSAMAALETAGVLAVAIRPPTVPAGASRLRFALSAAHSDADMDQLISAVEALA
ncbi:8-amino-7-oxononanoate synthase [Caenispirillum salinarum AK4]|uniref:8-amino-7-ketopelargonate synthase n=1 Tax=Caenispirillum salinarum AK4 TaxID=1238182 RepID=K9HR30_9PROT|nr:8-amino-7-oxononanoate synthase [Caenispirillum salinarum]EKV30891.1 8-amino-7-oxononanoate synthase [Caenispirillum salinarum AK4]